jgi:hypothetical protein
MAEWDHKGDKKRTEFPFSYCIEAEVSPREIVQMSKWLISEEGLKGRFFFERKGQHAPSMNPPVQFNFTDETTGMHFKLKYG